METTGFDVFDVHHHVGDARAFLGDLLDEADGVVAPEEAAAAEMAARLRIMDEGGVRQAAVIVSHGYERPNGVADTRRVNDGIAAYRAARPDRFPVAIGVVEPLHGRASFAELQRCRDELALDGISFHARFQGTSMDGPWVGRYLERIVELGLVPLLHAVVENVDEALWKTVRLARSWPETPMLVLDVFSTFEGTKECSFAAELASNLLFDTTDCTSVDFVETFVRRFGAERVLFGTDLYSPPLGKDHISPVKDRLASGPLTTRDKELILGGNARRLFGVS
jgi:predicted TIM-barrel fold metal-dependent hydrolase